jgi:hypothetical protein
VMSIFHIIGYFSIISISIVWYVIVQLRENQQLLRRRKEIGF